MSILRFSTSCAVSSVALHRVSEVDAEEQASQRTGHCSEEPAPEQLSGRNALQIGKIRSLRNASRRLTTASCDARLRVRRMDSRPPPSPLMEMLKPKSPPYLQTSLMARPIL